MKTQERREFSPRKTPVQARSGVTVEAIQEATIQVLLGHGRERLTTTRVAERAGVSVGTLYQYYPNKRALLFCVLEQHLSRVADAVERACREQLHQPLEAMVKGVVEAFVEAKMERTDISLALYSIASELDGEALVRRNGKRARKALTGLLETAPERQFENVQFTAMMMFAAMANATRAVLESGASLRMVRMLRRELVLLCHGYLAGSGSPKLE
jgi:AcrR family transcriptional regulator